jgi:hypothetical protein
MAVSRPRERKYVEGGWVRQNRLLRRTFKTKKEKVTGESSIKRTFIFCTFNQISLG